MYPRNAASPPRIAIGPVVQISDGAVQTSGVSIAVIPQGGASAAGGNSPAYDNGMVLYTPTQAETNYTAFVVTAYKTGCIPVSQTIVTTASGVAGYAGLDWATINAPTTVQGLTGTTVKTATDVETDTADIQSRLPAALVGGRIDANVGAISSDSVAADNAEAFFDGTGYAGTNNVIPLVTSVAAGGIAASSFAAGAIDATAIATGAIDADALAANAVDEIWAKALTELSAVPAVTATTLDALNWVFTLARNKIEQTSSTSTLKKDDGTTTLATSAVSDNGTTFERAKWS